MRSWSVRLSCASRENSRTVATAVSDRLKTISRSLPADIIVKPVLDRTNLVNSTITTVGRNLAEGAVLVIVVLFLLLGNIRAALIAALVIPDHCAADQRWDAESAGGVGQPNEPWRTRFRPDCRWRGHHCRKCPAPSCGAPTRAGRNAVSLEERLAIVAASAREMIRPSVYGQAIIILVYAPLLTFSGVEGKMFEPMALTVIIALVFAFILSLTFVPAAIAIMDRQGKRRRKGKPDPRMCCGSATNRGSTPPCDARA